MLRISNVKKLTQLVKQQQSVSFLVQKKFQHAVNPNKNITSDLNSVETSSSTSSSNTNTNASVQQQKEKKSFAKLFKESKFVSLGNLENKYVIGKIVEIVGDDLYIDYGGKFYCVCRRPTRNSHAYVRNENVKIKLNSFEMSAYFLNAAKNMTLLESDADLVEIYHGPSAKGEEDQDKLKVHKEVHELNSEPYY